MQLIFPTQRVLVLCGLAVACLAHPAPAQSTDLPQGQTSHADTLALSGRADTVVSLRGEFIVPGSDSVWIGDRLLEAGRDYVLDDRSGKLTLRADRMSSFIVGAGPATLRATYRSFPFTFRREYAHRQPVSLPDTGAVRKTMIVRPASKFSFDDLFGSNLQKSGSIVRGFSVGTNQDMSLSSGFRMQMSGMLTGGLEVIAALTDQNTPIQPEGTTQTLQEIDKVFVELRGTDLDATLGDFTLGLGGTEFGVLNRKLQGAKGFATYRVGGVEGDVMVAGAVSRGKFITNQYQGIDGMQGPYLLAGENNERSIIVIAGTERVYVDGERMTRGDNADYVIDYTNAAVTFTTRRLISRVSRIVVDFEYSDRQFSRTLVAAQAREKFLGGKLGLGMTFLRESDNENSTIDVTLSPDDLRVLRAAGNDPLRAAQSGVTLAGPGKGQYLALDSTVVLPSGRDTLLRVYRYAPADTANAVYTVLFSFVGFGRGSYQKVALGIYQFAGAGQGAYEPVRFLPLPESHTVADFDLAASLTDELAVSGEYALSNFDRNLFSSLGDDENNGGAGKFSLQYTPARIRIAGRDFGSFAATFRERYVGRTFAALDRTNDVEFARMWNITDSSALDEELREGAFTYTPREHISLGGSLGWLKRGDAFRSHRYVLTEQSAGEDVPTTGYELEVIRSRDGSLDLADSWTRQRASVAQRLGLLTPGIRLRNESLLNRSALTDTLKTGSYRLNEVVPGVSFGEQDGLTLLAEAGWEWDDSLASGGLQRAARGFLQHYSARLPQWNSFSSSLDLTLQNKKFTEEFRQRNNADVRTLLLRWQSRLAPWSRGIESDLFYEISTERSAKLERVFQQVPKGTGNYVYLGDLNGNHLQDADEFELSRFDGDYIAVTFPTDDLVPVVNVKASTRTRLTLSRFVPSGGWLAGALRALSAETYARVEEKSTDPDTKQLYFLHLSRFLNDRTTLAGSNLFTQDLYVLENNPALSLRLRYSQNKGLTQYALATERTYGREQSLRLRWQLVKEIANQVDYIIGRDVLDAQEAGNRVRDIRSNSLESAWSYRPQQQVELGFSCGFGSAQNEDTTSADLNDQSVRFVYSFEGVGQARAEMTREEVILARAGPSTPFELTSGKSAGRTWLWHLAFDYRLTRFIQATVGYDGRSEEGRAVVHTARAEVRALF